MSQVSNVIWCVLCPPRPIAVPNGPFKQGAPAALRQCLADMELVSSGCCCRRWWTLMATCAAVLLGATGQLHYKMYPRTVARIDAGAGAGLQLGHSSPGLLLEPSLEYVAKPDYAFAYGVEDPYSGSKQSHQEEREGDLVRGEYKVQEADGSLRTVTYTVDPKRGFQANVEHSDPDLSVPFSPYSSRQQLHSKAQRAQSQVQPRRRPQVQPQPQPQPQPPQASDFLIFSDFSED